MTRHAAAANPFLPRTSLSRVLLLGGALALLPAGARAAPDDCAANGAERDAFVAAAIIATLDAGYGAAGHPAWVRAFLSAPEEEGERLARWCEANPNMTLRAALEGLSKQDAAKMR